MASDGRLHSRIVAILKLILPLIAVLLLASLFLTPGEDGTEGELVFSEAEIADVGSGLEISRPTFSGMTRGDDVFQFSADKVVPDAIPPNRATITALVGTVDLANGGSVDLSAEAAELDIEAREIGLRGAVEVATSEGYLVTTEALDLDLGVGAMESAAPVRTDGPLGEITAGHLRIAPDKQGARIILFDDRVRLVYRPIAKVD